MIKFIELVILFIYSYALGTVCDVTQFSKLNGGETRNMELSQISKGMLKSDYSEAENTFWNSHDLLTIELISSYKIGSIIGERDFSLIGACESSLSGSLDPSLTRPY